MRSPTRTRAPNWASSLVLSQSPIRIRSPKRARTPLRSRSPSAQSPSPRSKRLKRAQAGREMENVRGRDYDRSNNKDYDRARHKDTDRGSNRDGTRESRGKDKYRDISGKSRHAQSMSPKDHRQRQRHDSPSPTRKSSVHGAGKPRSAIAAAHDEVPNHSVGETPRSDNLAHDAVAKMKATEEALEAKQKEKQQKPSFELSGKLAAETNKVRGVTLLFNEPPDAQKPTIRWRLYVFKAGEVLNEPLYVHRQSCYLFGRERRVADIPTDHPSCSKQHAVIQFRLVEKEESDGTISKQVRPYLMDLGSTNGTRLNDTCLEPQRYYELFEKDTIRFGNSRYVGRIVGVVTLFMTDQLVMWVFTTDVSFLCPYLIDYLFQKMYFVVDSIVYSTFILAVCASDFELGRGRKYICYCVLFCGRM